MAMFIVKVCPQLLSHQADPAVMHASSLSYERDMPTTIYLSSQANAACTERISGVFRAFGVVPRVFTYWTA